MIVGTLAMVSQQAALTDGIQKAVAWLKENAGKEWADGRVVIDGDNVFALVQSYTSKTDPEVRVEGHKKYIDVQYVVSGVEAMGWAVATAATVGIEYMADKDVWLGTVPADQMTWTRLEAGQLAVLYPEDAHAPQRAWNGASMPIKKIVVKVAV